LINTGFAMSEIPEEPRLVDHAPMEKYLAKKSRAIGATIPLPFIGPKKALNGF
jgi:hypothetical protein